MKRLLKYLLVIIFFCPDMLSGQISTSDTPALLEKLYGRLVNNSSDEMRIQINDSIKSIIDNYVLSDTIFNHRFKNLKYLGQITSPDSIVKIVTWNLLLRESPGRYFCYFIRKQDTGKKNLIYNLSAEYKTDTLKTDTTYTEKNWYGALYYDIRPIAYNNNKCWILLGADYGNMFISRKIIDVLSFSAGDSLIFGKKWFVADERAKYRDVFEYASNGMMSLRFSTDKSIVFDHLVPFSPAMKDNREYYGPDYSYDAYYFEDGFWKLTINVDARNKE